MPETWLQLERNECWDSPARTWFKDILARGQAAVAGYPERKPGGPGPALTEEQVNRVGYWLLAKKKVKEAVAVFERNAADFPASWNVHDSMGEACAADGQRDRAIASYKKPLALNPSNTNATDHSANSRPRPPPTRILDSLGEGVSRRPRLWLRYDSIMEV